MKIIFVGAGNLATHLATALYDAGHDIVQVYSRTGISAKTLADKVDSIPVTEISNLRKDADACIMSVKDSALEHLIHEACTERKNMVFMHTAGSIPMSVFDGWADNYGVFYPMQSFSKKRELNFRNIPCFLEWNNDKVKTVIEQLAESVSDVKYNVNSEVRKQLHLAAVFASNFVNHCYEMSSELLEEHNLPFDVMLPLVDEIAAKVHEMKPRDAQTGPAIRYDKNVMKMHTDMLEDKPLMKEIYETMSKSIHKTATEK